MTNLRTNISLHTFYNAFFNTSEKRIGAQYWSDEFNCLIKLVSVRRVITTASMTLSRVKGGVSHSRRSILPKQKLKHLIFCSLLIEIHDKSHGLLKQDDGYAWPNELTSQNAIQGSMQLVLPSNFWNNLVTKASLFTFYFG